MKVLLVASELADLAPVGGLAEYLLGLAAALVRRGHDVRVAIPAYAYLRAREDVHIVNPRLPVSLGVGMSEVSTVRALSLACPGQASLRLSVLLLGEHKHLATVSSTKEIYQWPNHEPWIAFSRAVIDWLEASDWRPDVIHCNDAHTALVPVYVRWLREQTASGWTAKVRTVLTVHNLLNQGKGEAGLVAYAGLPMSWFTTDLFEYYGQANCFKAGLLCADRVNAVSRTYAQEICGSSEYGFGLEGIFHSLRQKGRLHGILNGIDESRWRMNGVHYDGTREDVERALAAKKGARAQFFGQWQVQDPARPLVAFRSRWDRQKGVELITEGMSALLKLANVAMVTWGYSASDEVWQRLNRLASQHPGRLIINPEGVSRVDQTAAHYAVADLFLMPSRYEPCGLTQMECQRYGTLPVVRKTGGLADTVSEANGFVFQEFKAGAMVEAVERAAGAFRNPEWLRRLVGNALQQRNGWDNRMSEYEELYRV